MDNYTEVADIDKIGLEKKELTEKQKLIIEGILFLVLLAIIAVTVLWALDIQNKYNEVIIATNNLSKINCNYRQSPTRLKE